MLGPGSFYFGTFRGSKGGLWRAKTFTGCTFQRMFRCSIFCSTPFTV
jgi:hypothetical protein